MPHPKTVHIPSLSPWGAQTGSRWTNVLCSDGKYRTFTATAEADTFFTIPGRVKVKGKTVTGHIYWDSEIFNDDPNPGVYKFSAFTYRKNHDMLPEWDKEEPIAMNVDEYARLERFEAEIRGWRG